MTNGGWSSRLAGRFASLGRRGPGAPVFLAVSALLAVAFFASFVFRPDRILFGTDMLDQAYQLRQFAVEEIRAGRGFPLWNPYVFGGLPYLAILPGPLFYPSSLLYPVLPLGRAIGWTFVLHVWLAGVLAYLAGRTFGLRRWAAAVTGLAFMFTGYFVSHLYGGQDGRMFAMALIPAAFALTERGLRSGNVGPFLGLGIVVALQALTPHVQMMYFSSLAVCLYAAWRLSFRVMDLRRGDSVWPEGGSVGDDLRRAVVRPAVLLGAAFVVSGLLAAVQILPTAELLRHAVRGAGQGGGGGYEFAASWALPPQELSAFLLPDLIGSLQTYWGANQFKLHTEYLGAVTLALALVGLVAGRRSRLVWFLGGAAALGVAFALGSATPVHRIAYEIVPFIDRFRAPAMMLGPVAFLVAMLAGVGCHAVLEERQSGEGGIPWLWVWVLSAPILFLALAAALSPEGLLRWLGDAWFAADHPRSPSPDLVGSLRLSGFLALFLWAGTLAAGQGIASRRIPRWTLAVVALLLAVDLWRVGDRYLETVDYEAYRSPGPVVEHMREELAPGQRVWPLENTFGPNELMLHRVPSVSGSQNFRLAWFDALVGGVGQENLARHPVLWPLLGIRFLTLRSQVESPLLEPVARHGETIIYEVAVDVPHAYFPREVRRARDLDEAIRRTLELADPVAVAWVEADGATGASSDIGQTGTSAGEEVPAGEGSARLVRWEPDRVELEVEARREGLLFLSEIYHPAWRAEIDGREVPVHRVNAAFRGVVVPEGSSVLHLEYRSTPARAGFLISGTTATALILFFAVSMLRGRVGDHA